MYGDKIMTLLSLCNIFSCLNYLCLLGDGSCFIVQQDLDYVIELTGADCDPVYKVQLSGIHSFERTESGHPVVILVAHTALSNMLGWKEIKVLSQKWLHHLLALETWKITSSICTLNVE